MSVYARSTTVHGRPEAVDAGLTEVRDTVMPAVQELDGFVGLSMLVDRRTGQCIVTTAWRDADALHASAGKVRSMRSRAAQALGGTPEVQEWEIAVMHRMHTTTDGACARLTWLKVDPASLDRQIDSFRTMVLPRAEGFDGFCSASLMVDRETGRAVAAVTYDSRTALEDSRASADALRTETARVTGAAVLDIHEFDVALAHLRVPETV